MEFELLGLHPLLLAAVRAAGYREPTPIQQQAIPPALTGRDILGTAQTGTGKTAAFCLPILQRLAAGVRVGSVPRALVLTPTRELAAQIDESIATYRGNLALRHAVIFGGVSEAAQIRALRRGVDIVVATPGRLLDLMGQGEVRLDAIEVFVLDEADRMLDMGFLPDVRRITERLPQKRQTMLFSATMPPEIRGLADRWMHDPAVVAVDPPSSTAQGVEDQRVFFVDKHDKRRLLLEILADRSVKRALLFTRTKHGANRVVEHLERASVPSAAIHGNKSQAARVRALERFRAGGLRVLVATDLAARGIDVEGISHVINFDLPNVPETYVHRVGRTGRAGQSGIALSFCDDEERAFLVDIERLIGRHLVRVETHGCPPSRSLPPPTDLTSRRRGAAPTASTESEPRAATGQARSSFGGRGPSGGHWSPRRRRGRPGGSWR